MKQKGNQNVTNSATSCSKSRLSKTPVLENLASFGPASPAEFSRREDLPGKPYFLRLGSELFTPSTLQVIIVSILYYSSIFNDHNRGKEESVRGEGG
jgi:hypothetical protein